MQTSSQSSLYNVNSPEFGEAVSTPFISQLYVSLSECGLLSIPLRVDNGPVLVSEVRHQLLRVHVGYRSEYRGPLISTSPPSTSKCYRAKSPHLRLRFKFTRWILLRPLWNLHLQTQRELIHHSLRQCLEETHL